MAGTKKIGAKIVIDGEAEFRSAINSSKNAMKEFDSEMKLVTAQFKNNAQSMEALKSKQAVYQKQQQELTKQNKLLVEQIQKANTAYKEAEDVHQKTADSIKKLEKELSDAKKEYGENADEVRDLEQQLKEANTEYDKQGRALNNLSNQITKWNTDLNKVNTELVQTEDALKDTNNAIDDYGDNVKNAEQETKKFSIVAKDASEGTDSLKVSLGSLVTAQVVVDVLRNCANAIKDVATAAIDVGAKFEASMSNVQALSGATGKELEDLTNKAKEMGKSTIYSAKESADAFSFMSLAGWDAKQMLEGIEPVLNLAAAANMDLAQASDIVTDYITAFGLKASDAGRFADSMAYAMSNSNTTVELLGESYKNCAATAGSMGVAFEDATAVLMTMANAGVKGGEAGTALSSIMTRLATNTSECNDKLEKYGITVYDSEGNMNRLSSILNGLGAVWGTLSDKEQAALAKSIAGVSHYSKFQTIMLGVSDAAKEGGQSFDDYAEALRDCEGAASAMAQTMQDNLTGDVTILKSALEGLGIATESVFDDAFREAVQGATDAVSQMEQAITSGDLGVSLTELGDALADVTQSFITSAEEGLPDFIEGLTWILNNIDSIGAGIKAVAVGFGVYEAATLAATIATEGLTVALSTNAITLLVGTLVGASAALLSFSASMDKAVAKQSEMSDETRRQIEHYKSFNDSVSASAEKREAEARAIEAQATASHKLVDELYNSNTTQERQKQIVSELKSIYPELNLAIDEQGKVIGSTREELDKYIDTSLETAKVEAAKTRLTEIAKEQFEAEQKLAEIEKNVEQSVRDLDVATREYNEDAKNHVDMNGNMVEVQNEYSQALDRTKDAYAGFKAEEAETKETIKNLGEEYEKTLQYIGDNAPIDEATESTNEMSEAEQKAVEITKQLQDEFDKLYESISNSIGSSLDLTNQWSQNWGTSTGQMTSNIESQIKGIQDWGDNFATLADSAEVSIDQRVLKYLADMGTEGAGLVQQLVDTLKSSPDELQDFSDKLAQYLSLEDSVAQEITDSYSNCVIEGMQGAINAVEENSEPLAEAMTELSEASMEGFEEVWGEGGTEFYAKAEAAMNGLTEGITSGTPQVKTAAKNMADTTNKEVDNSFGISGNTSKTYTDKGKTIATSLANGMKANQNALQTAAQELGQTAHDTLAAILSEESGYAIGQKWINAVVAAINEGAPSVIAALEKIQPRQPEEKNDDEGGGGEGGGDKDTYNGSYKNTYPFETSKATMAALEGINNYVNSPVMQKTTELSESVDRLADVVSEYLPKNTSTMTNVSVELSGEVSDIFNVVKVENDRVIRATGYNPLG